MKEDCDVGGKYCEFHKWLVHHIKQLKNQDWFPEFKHFFETTEIVWNKYENTPSFAASLVWGHVCEFDVF